MATGNGIDYIWKTYTDDLTNEWSIRVDKDWGNNAASGLTAFDSTLPAWPKGNYYRPRKVVLQDLVSGRTTSRVLGNPAASAGVPGATVSTVARGAAGTYTLTSRGFVGERRPRTGTIFNHAEPITT